MSLLFTTTLEATEASTPVFEAAIARGRCSQLLRKFLIDPFLNHDTASMRRLPFTKWRSEIGKLSTDEGRLYIESDNTYYLEYGETLLRFDRVPKSQHDYEWTVTRMRPDYEWIKNRYRRLSIFAIRASLNELALPDSKYIEERIAPKTPGENRNITIWDPVQIFEALAVDHPLVKIDIPVRRLLEKETRSTKLEKIVGISFIAGLTSTAYFMLSNFLPLWGWGIPFLHMNPYAYYGMISTIPSFFALVIAHDWRNRRRCEKELDILQKNRLSKKGKEWDKSVGSLLPTGDFDQEFYVVLMRYQTEYDDPAMSLQFIKSSTDQDFIQFKTQYEPLWSNYPEVTYGVVRIKGHKSDQKITAHKISVEIHNPRSSALGPTQQLNPGDALNLIGRITSSVELSPDAEIEIDSSLWRGKKIQISP